MSRVRRLFVLGAALGVISVPSALAADLTGTEGPDSLIGTAQSDRIDALGGDDTVAAGDARHTVFGGFGADEIQGGAGPDDLRGGPGTDRVDGGPGSDMILGVGGDTPHGGDDADVLRAKRGSSVLYGGEGAHYLESRLTSGYPQLHGDVGDDVLVANRDRFDPPWGHASLYGGQGEDYLDSKDDGEVRGRPDGDEIHATRASIVDGGDGDDLLVTDGIPATATPMRCGPGNDAVQGDIADLFPDDCEQVVVNIRGRVGGEAHVAGTPYDDHVELIDGGNLVETFGGDDEVFPGSGGAGDQISLGPGDDLGRCWTTSGTSCCEP